MRVRTGAAVAGADIILQVCGAKGAAAVHVLDAPTGIGKNARRAAARPAAKKKAAAA